VRPPLAALLVLLGTASAAEAQDAIGQPVAPPPLGVSGTAGPLDAATLAEAARRYGVAERARLRAERVRLHVRRPTTMPKMNEWLRRRFLPAFRRRIEAIERAEEAYDDVITLGHSEHAVASLRRVGDLYFDFALAIEAIPAPIEIARDLALHQTYRDALAEQARTIRERAYASYEACVHTARALGLDDPHVQHARARLAQHAPERLPS
jgi:hypothetical protein